MMQSLVTVLVVIAALAIGFRWGEHKAIRDVTRRLESLGL